MSTSKDNVFVGESVTQQDTINFAIVTGVYDDGLTLRLDGEELPTQKKYKCNSSCVFKVGDKVRIIKDSGTYVVEYPVGNPVKKVDMLVSKSDVATTAEIAIVSQYIDCNDDHKNLRFSVNASAQVYIHHPSHGWLQLK